MSNFRDFPKDINWQVCVKIISKEKRFSKAGLAYYLMKCVDDKKKEAFVLLWEDEYLSCKSEFKNNSLVIIEISEYNQIYDNFKFASFVRKIDKPVIEKKIDPALRKIMGTPRKSNELRRIMGISRE